MPDSPKSIEQKISTIIDAWKKLRPASKFGAMTLDEFTAKVQPSFDHRKRLKELETEIAAETDLRDDADAASLDQVKLVVNSVKGDPEEG